MRVRTVIVLMLAGGVLYWIEKKHPTVSGLVEGLTRPLMASKAAVKESEHKRVIAQAVPAAHEGEEISMGTVREGMTAAEVRELLGPPEQIELFQEKGRHRVRWTYAGAGRVLVFEDGRVVSIAIR